MPRPKTFIVSALLLTWPVAAFAQTPAPGPTSSPKADDPSYGTTSQPASMGNPVTMSPDAARKDGATPAGTPPSGTDGAKH